MEQDAPDLENGSFGALLRKLRLARGLTQEELAERAGLSVRGLSDLERGVRRRARPETFAPLAGALGLDPTERTHPDRLLHRSPLRRPTDYTHSAEEGTPHHNLPRPLTTLVGRKHQIAEA